MIAKPSVAIITPTIGTKFLEQNLDSINKQTYKNLKHIVVSDGKEHNDTVSKMLKKFSKSKHLPLFENTGKGGYNGHRIYAACTYLIDADYFCFIDEDNYLDSEHIEALVEAVKNNHWAFSFRKIVDQSGKFICNDDCESLGNWKSCIGDYFVDVGCYFLPKNLCVQMSPLFYRRARHPEEQPEIDRIMMSALLENNLKGSPSYKYSLNYRAGNRVDSVRAEFFLNGNEFMLRQYNGVLPWKKQ